MIDQLALRKAFDEFCLAEKAQWDDFEYLYYTEPYNPVAPAYLDDEPYSGLGERRELEAIGMANADSQFGWWAAPNTSADTRPIVYIDSEGSPVGACAGSFAEFLTLLPYGTMLLYQVLRWEENKRENPERWEHRPDELADPELPARQLGEQAANYEGHADYVNWLTGTAGLTVAPDPVALIRQAYHRYLGFIEWLGWE